MGTREEHMQLGEKYRPMGIARFKAALDVDSWLRGTANSGAATMG